MINFSLFCQTNHWPARVAKINIILKKIQKLNKYLYFNVKFNYNCNIVLADNKFIKKLNYKYRKKTNPTDVLTFVSEINYKKDQKIKICDIFLSIEIIKKDSKKNSVSFYNHLTHVLIHSFLHINGFDHKRNQDFYKMKKAEIFLLNKFNINNPYI